MSGGDLEICKGYDSLPARGRGGGRGREGPRKGERRQVGKGRVWESRERDERGKGMGEEGREKEWGRG